MLTFARMDYLDKLNTAQREAVEHTEGPSMVIAGAGSGKTRVLTYRIAHLINKGVDAFGIMALTFTNKAAREMKDRIAEIVGPGEARNIRMGTFHSVFARILRSEAEKLNFTPRFTIYDTSDSKNLIKSIVKEMGLDDKLYKTSTVQNRISAAKNNLISPTAYRENAEIMSDDEVSGRKHIVDIYAAYNRRLFKADAMDFDDLLYKTNVLLRDFPEVLHKYQHRFKYLLVDEYQDTNFSQYLIVKKLAALNENLCVVGDDAQSIYGFRGANIQNILNFRKDYPDYRLFKLEQNYRSSKTIVGAANSVIDKNRDQIRKKVWTDNDKGEVIRVVRALSDNEEGLFVANDIFAEKNTAHLNNKSFAILYRTNSQSRSMEEALRKVDIPYRIYGGMSFYQRKEVKDLLAYYRLTANHNDEEALKRVINYPARGIGKTTLEKVTVLARDMESSLWDALTVHADRLKVNTGTRGRLADFTTMIKSFAAQLESEDAFVLAEHIAKSTGLLGELYADKSPEGLSRYENIQELLNGIKEFSENEHPEFEGRKPGLSDFLMDVALLTDADNDDGDDDKVSLMTIHASKGLEFRKVYIVGLEENLFPSQMALSERSELEEERRLFYVALTRAEQKATLTYATSRYRYGSLNYCEPSRFLEEVDPQYVDLPEEGGGAMRRSGSFDERPWAGLGARSTGSSSKVVGKFSRGKREKKVTGSGTAPDRGNLKRVGSASQDVGDILAPGAISTGDKVVHGKFGKGKVINIEGAAPNEKATVFFPAVGQKQLLLKYAKLKVVGRG